MNRRLVFHLLLSAGISFLLLGVLLRGLTGAAAPSVLPRLLAALAAVAGGYIFAYAGCGFLQGLLRAIRYRVILKASEDHVPGLYHMSLVALSRNMFVDMLPARLGELSYVAMLNRGYRVSAEACLSSLAVSFVFDLVALSLLLLGLIGYQALHGDLKPWLLGSFLLVTLVGAILLAFLFPVLGGLRLWLQRLAEGKGKIINSVANLAGKTAESLEKTRKGGIFGRVLILSLAIRIVKYLGLYVLFLGVVLPSFPGIDTRLAPVLAALIGGEAAASLPLPTFMSFGAYETGGTLALMFLGAARAVSALVMLALHIWSQVIDYTMGIAALVLFVFSVGKLNLVAGRAVRNRGWRKISLALLLLAAGLFVFGLQVRGIKKMGALRPPSPGVPVATGRPADQRLAGLHGFIVWSSNRFGNHDIVMLSLPEQKLSRLTTDPHTEYFPRISPDGKQIVFCRSREPWVSQRNYFAWDVYLLNLENGRERLVAKNGNVPTWSADGKKIYFQRNANQFVEYNLASRKETVLFESGKNLPWKSSVVLETPVWSAARQSLAVTLRGAMRGTVVVDRHKKIERVDDGCELNWAPDSSYLYYVGHGGKEQNAFYKVDPVTLKRSLWFDSPTKYSHEYFPKVANNGRYLVYGASTGGHEHDVADYEIFLWKIGSPPGEAVRISFYTGNDCWPDIYLY
ncbi:MAG: hypothetical protein GXP57_06780 [Deltaproteobacteria bacterium]|nr:hypothetical protein [Deltaproteobacteria bacterium]